jgi:hypothetical protein
MDCLWETVAQAWKAFLVSGLWSGVLWFVAYVAIKPRG